jgi:hypothetical protein
MEHMGMGLLTPDIMPCKVPACPRRPWEGDGVPEVDSETGAAWEGGENHGKDIVIDFYNINVVHLRKGVETTDDAAQTEP